jgi:hypothetical protein
MKPRRTVDAVAIEKRERRIPELGGAIHQRFGKRRTLQKAEGGRGVEFDVRRRHEDTVSIHDRVDEPPVGVSIAEHDVHRTVAERDIPFVAIERMGKTL